MPDALQFTVILEPQLGGGYAVTVPALPEVITEGDSKDEALKMAKDAISLALSYRRDHGIPVPADAVPSVHRVTIAA